MTLRDLLSHFTADWKRVDPVRTVLLVFLILAVFSAGWQYLMPQVKEISTTTFKAVPQIKKVVEVQRVYIPCPEQGIVALDKHEVAKKLDMPWLEQSPPAPTSPKSPTGPTSDETLAAGEALPPVAGNPAALQVTATADLQKTDNGHQVVSLLNTETGITTLIVKEKSAPWWEWNNALVAGIRYGLNHRLEQTGTVYSSWEFLRIKDLHLIGYGELNTNAEGKIQADLQYRR